MEDLKTALNLRKRANFPNKTGVPPTVDGVLAAINKLSSLHYGIPGFAVAALSLEPGQVPDVSSECSSVLAGLIDRPFFCSQNSRWRSAASSRISSCRPRATRTLTRWASLKTVQSPMTPMQRAKKPQLQPPARPRPRRRPSKLAGTRMMTTTKALAKKAPRRGLVAI